MTAKELKVRCIEQTLKARQERLASATSKWQIRSERTAIQTLLKEIEDVLRIP